MALTKEQSLREAIAHEEAQLAELAHKHNESQERLAALKAELATMESTPVVPSALAVQSSADIPTTAEGKISLFRKLFDLICLYSGLFGAIYWAANCRFS